MFMFAYWMYLLSAAALGLAPNGVMAALGFSAAFVMLFVVFPPKTIGSFQAGMCFGAITYFCAATLMALIMLAAKG